MTLPYGIDMRSIPDTTVGGKFDNAFTEGLYDWMIEGGLSEIDSLSNPDDGGWAVLSYLIDCDTPEHAEAVILEGDSRGFVYSTTYQTLADARDVWDTMTTAPYYCDTEEEEDDQ